MAETSTPEEVKDPKLTAPPTVEAPAAAAPISQLPKTPIPSVKPLEPLKPSETTEGRVKQMTTTRSPLLTTASTRAKQRMAGRGILSSTLTEQAATQAVIEAATPIAAQDAAAAQRRNEIQFQAEQAVAAEERAADRQRTGILFQAQEARSTAEIAADARREEIKTELASKYDIIQFEADMQANEAELQRQWQDGNVSDQNSRVLAEQYRSSVNTTNQYWDNQTQLVLNTPDSVMSDSDKRKRLSQIESSRESAIGSVTATYAAAPDWDVSWGVEIAAPADVEDLPEDVRSQLKLDLDEDPIFLTEVTSKSSFAGEASFKNALGKLDEGVSRDELLTLIGHAKVKFEAAVGSSFTPSQLDYWITGEGKDSDFKPNVGKWVGYLQQLNEYLEGL